MTIKEIQEMAYTANKILVVDEMVKQLTMGETKSWDPVNIIVDAVGKDNLQYCLSNYLNELKQKLKEDIAEL